MTRLTIMECRCHKWPRIYSTCRKHFPVISWCMTYHRFCNLINTTVATSAAWTAYPSEVHPRLLVGFRITRSLVLCVCFVDRCLSFFLLVIVLSVHLRFTGSDYHFGIFKLFFSLIIVLLLTSSPVRVVHLLM